jgi:hypothetical protein
MFLLIFMLLSTLIISMAPYFIHVNAVLASGGGTVLVNSENFNDYGQFGINDTLIVGRNSTQSISSVTFGFPSVYNGHIFAESATLNNGPPLNSSSITGSVANNVLQITVAISSSLSSSNPGNVSLRFYVVGVYTSQNTTSQSCTTCYYLAPMVLYPSVNINSSSLSLNSNITFPDPSITKPSSNSTSALDKLGFSSQTTGSFFRLYNSTTLNSQTSGYASNPHWANVSIGSSSTNAGVVDFQSIDRSISVGSSGNLIVKDSFLIANRGPNTLSSLDFSVLTGNGSSTVTILPSGQPLLSNAQTTTATSGVLDVLSASGNTIEPNATTFIVIQYNLGQQYWSQSGGTYTAKIPLSVPVNAIVDNFQISYNVPSGFVTLQSPHNVDLTNTHGQSGTATLSYRAGIGSSYVFVLPVAAFLFLAVFVAALVFKPRGEKVAEEVETTLSTLVKAVEDKVSGTNDILSELESKGTSVSRIDLSTARTRIEDLRSKSSGRFGTIRTELGTAGSASAAALNQVATDDREFDRAVKDLLNTYDQFISRRMKQDSFSRSQQNNERRLQRITNSLLDGLQNLRREYEQEQ